MGVQAVLGIQFTRCALLGHRTVLQHGPGNGNALLLAAGEVHPLGADHRLLFQGDLPHFLCKGQRTRPASGECASTQLFASVRFSVANSSITFCRVSWS